MQFYVGYDVSASIIRCLEDLHISDLLVILPHFYYGQTGANPKNVGILGPRVLIVAHIKVHKMVSFGARAVGG